MAGIFHAYYTVALAPAIGALVGIGAILLWQRRDDVRRGAGDVVHARVHHRLRLLPARPDPRLPALAQVGRRASSALAAALLLVGVRHLPRSSPSCVAGAALVAGLAAPAAYSVTTAGTAHTGSIPTAGPSSGGGPGGDGRRAPRPGLTQSQPPNGTGATTGGLLEGSQSSAAITALLQTDADSYTWAAAAIGSNSAAGYQLASEEPVMAIGGFNGSDPSPTLAQFKAVRRRRRRSTTSSPAAAASAAGRVAGGSSSGSSTSSEISTWVAASFTATTVDGVTLYDLSGGVQ